MKKKAMLFTLEEVIKLVLGVMILAITIGLVWSLAYKVLGEKKASPSEKSFDALLTSLNGIKQNQMIEVPVFLDHGPVDDSKAYIILGFPKGDAPLSGSCSGDGLHDQVKVSTFPKPVTICGTEPCLCLYHAKMHYGTEYDPDGPPIKCEIFEYPLYGGTFTLTKERLKLWTRWQWAMDLFKASPDEFTVSCGPAIIPSFGGVTIIQAVRENNEIYLCWGDDCQENVRCDSFGDHRCAENKDKCYPTYKSYDWTQGVRKIEYDGCKPCPDTFTCGMISTSCKSPECEAACLRGHCGTTCQYQGTSCQ